MIRLFSHKGQTKTLLLLLFFANLEEFFQDLNIFKFHQATLITSLLMTNDTLKLQGLGVSQVDRNFTNGYGHSDQF